MLIINTQFFTDKANAIIQKLEKIIFLLENKRVTNFIKFPEVWLLSDELGYFAGADLDFVLYKPIDKSVYDYINSNYADLLDIFRHTTETSDWGYIISIHFDNEDFDAGFECFKYIDMKATFVAENNIYYNGHLDETSRKKEDLDLVHFHTAGTYSKNLLDTMFKSLLFNCLNVDFEELYSFDQIETAFNAIAEKNIDQIETAINANELILNQNKNELISNELISNTDVNQLISNDLILNQNKNELISNELISNKNDEQSIIIDINMLNDSVKDKRIIEGVHKLLEENNRYKNELNELKKRVEEKKQKQIKRTIDAHNELQEEFDRMKKELEDRDIKEQEQLKTSRKKYLDKLEADKEEKEIMAAKIRVLEEENNALKQKLLTEKKTD
jgi:hypothetical protein